MELNKLHIFVRKSSARNHSSTVASARVCAGAGEVRTTITSRGKDGVLRSEAVNAAVLHTHSYNTWSERDFSNMECVHLTGVSVLVNLA